MSNRWLSKIRKFFFRVISLPISLIGIAFYLGVYACALAGCVVMFFHFALLPVQRAWEAGAWQETPCTITRSWIEEHEDRERRYAPRVEYTYSYRGREYWGNRHSCAAEWASETPEPCHRFVSKYPVGAEQVCYVNPDRASESVLCRGYEWGNIVFGLLGVPAMLFLLHYVLRPLFRRGVPSADAQGPVKLRSQRSITFYSIATGGIIFAVLALITAFFYLDDVSPFALGLCVFAAIAPLYLFIAFGSLLNPRLTVNVFPFPVRAGEEFEVEWEFSGNTARLRKLTVTLEGMKKERLRNSLVQAVCITKTEDALTFAQGKALCAVPVDICPSGEDNVTWNLCFHGAIPTPLWPDVYGKFEVRIAPGRNDA